MTKFKTQWNREEKPYSGRVFTMPSMTSPDMTMSIREIFQRYAAGLPIGGATKQAIYDDESIGINPKTLDLVDLQALKYEAETTKTKSIEKLKELQELEDKKQQQQQIQQNQQNNPEGQ